MTTRAAVLFLLLFLYTRCPIPSPYPSPVISHSCVIVSGGFVRCWGANGSGQLGYGHTNNIGDDEMVSTCNVNLGAGVIVTQIAVREKHTCALLSNDNVRCWGANGVGQLGYRHTDNIGDDELPDSMGDVDLGLASGVTVSQIAAGDAHTCALLNNNTVRCWGANGVGQLGYRHTDNIGDDELPDSMGDVDLGLTLGVTVSQIAAGDAHTCALLNNNTVRCWGANGVGQLGYGHTDNIGDDELPDSMGDVDLGLAPGITVTQIAAGYGHTCALLSNGNVRCWGWNKYGQLGYGHTDVIGDDENPSSVANVDVEGTVTKITVIDQHSCALLAGGGLKCWGANFKGQLGYGHHFTIGNNESPASAGNLDLNTNVIDLWE